MAKKTEEPKLDEQQLVADDLNKTLQLDPKIDIDLPEEELEEQIKVNAGEVYYKDPEHGTDQLQESTFAYLLGKGYLTEPEPTEPANPAADAKPAKAAKAPKEPKAAKPAKEKAPKKEKPAKAPKEPKAAAEPRYTRDDAVTEAIKELGPKGFTMDDLLKRSDEIAVENGLKSNPTATNVNRYMVLALVNFGVLVQDGKIFKNA